MSTPQPKGNNKEKIKMQLILWEAYGIVEYNVCIVYYLSLLI